MQGLYIHGAILLRAIAKKNRMAGAQYFSLVQFAQCTPVLGAPLPTCLHLDAYAMPATAPDEIHFRPGLGSIVRKGAAAI
jgi:hypothetical protein